MGINTELLENNEPLVVSEQRASKKLELCSESYKDTIHKRIDLEDILISLETYSTISKDEAEQINELLDGRLFKRISLEEYTTIPTKTNLAFTLSFIKDDIKDKATTDRERILAALESLEKELEEDTLDYQEELTESLVFDKEVVSKLYQSSIRVFDVDNKEVDPLNCPIESITLTYFDELKECLADYKGFNYFGLKVYLKTLLGMHITDTLTLKKLKGLTDPNNKTLIVGISDYQKKTISRLTEMKDELTEINKDDEILTWMNTEAEKLLKLVEDYYDTKQLMTDLISFNKVYKNTLTYLVALL